jgi:hypothetical protein
VAKVSKAIGTYIEECQPFVEEDIMAMINDDFLKLGIMEARRYAKVKKVSTPLKSSVTPF